MLIGVLGGTGPLGRGIALRLAASGHDVVLGSRDAEKADAVVAELRSEWPAVGGRLQGGGNGTAAKAELVVLATVWDAAVETAREHADALAGRVVVCVANGMKKGKRELQPVLMAEGSVSAAVQEAAPEALVVAAFQQVPAAELGDLDHQLSCDILVASDDDAARVVVMDLIDGIPGLRAFDAGSLANALGIEAFTAALITVNIRHRGAASVHLGGVESRATTAP